MAAVKHHKKYNASWQSPEPVSIELACIARNGSWKRKDGVECGNGLAFHIRTLATMIWPSIKWHRWMKDLLIPEFCKGGRIAVFGPSNSGKSFSAAVFSLLMYYARPNNTTVLVSSTTGDELELRIWGEIKKLHRRAKERIPWLPGYMIDSKKMIITDAKSDESRDFRNGIICRPTRRGNEWVGLGSFVGIKNENMIVVADELQFMVEGFLKALANLCVNPNTTAIGMGNMNDLNTQLGEAAEPEMGWDSLPDSDVSRVYPTRWLGGRAIQLIGKDSPQLDYPDGAEPFDPIIGRKYIRECEHNYGLDTPLYNMFAAGKIPRGTLENRIITKQVCLKFHAYEPIEWGHEPLTRLYAADISYTAEHGDRTAGRPFAFGKDVDGKLRIAPLDRPKVYAPSDRAEGTIEYQLAVMMKAECEKWEVPPERLFFDGTGRSSFTSAIMKTWSTAVHAIEFGGTATPRPNFLGRKYQDDSGRQKRGDLLPCNEVFGKFVTELWFAFRYAVEADQFRGLDDETAKEFFLRLWKLLPGNKMDAEPKKEMKLRLGRSPDLADCVVCGLEGARRLGFQLGQIAAPKPRQSQWLRKVSQQLDEARKSEELLSI